MQHRMQAYEGHLSLSMSTYADPILISQLNGESWYFCGSLFLRAFPTLLALSGLIMEYAYWYLIAHAIPLNESSYFDNFCLTVKRAHSMIGKQKER